MTTNLEKIPRESESNIINRPNLSELFKSAVKKQAHKKTRLNIPTLNNVRDSWSQSRHTLNQLQAELSRRYLEITHLLQLNKKDEAKNKLKVAFSMRSEIESLQNLCQILEKQIKNIDEGYSSLYGQISNSKTNQAENNENIADELEKSDELNKDIQVMVKNYINSDKNEAKEIDMLMHELESKIENETHNESKINPVRYGLQKPSLKN